MRLMLPTLSHTSNVAVYDHLERALLVIRSLFTPFDLGGITLRNRVVMAPMTRSRAGAGNAPTPLVATYYLQRASAGLIITEATQVAPEGVGYPNTPGIHTEEQVAGWRPVVDAVHGHDGRIFLQLWHVGRVSHPSFQPRGQLPVAPSAIAPEGSIYTAAGPRPFEVPRAVDAREVPGITEQFRRGAVRALAAGFDGVEIHAANGYLIDQFLRDGTNRRTDRYGGSVENRVRFLVEVTEAVASVWGGVRVGVRISPTNPFNSMRDSDPLRTFVAAADALTPFGLAYLHVVEDAPPAAGGRRPAVTSAIRRVFRGPLMVNGGYDGARAATAITEGAADLVSFAALFLANPDLPARLARQASLNPPDPATFYGGDEVGYTDYPTLEAVPACVECAR